MYSSPYQARLLVDGYNIIGAWSELKKSRDLYGLEVARRELIETLINYAAVRTYQTQIVFDAYYQKTPSYIEEYTSFLSVYYTSFAETADTYIEKLCAAFRNNKYQDKYARIIVATSDRAQQLTVTGYGAEWLSAQKLAGEVEIAATKVKRKKKGHKRASGRLLFNSLDPVAQEIFQQWRHGD